MKRRPLFQRKCIFFAIAALFSLSGGICSCAGDELPAVIEEEQMPVLLEELPAEEGTEISDTSISQAVSEGYSALEDPEEETEFSEPESSEKETEFSEPESAEENEVFEFLEEDLENTGFELPAEDNNLADGMETYAELSEPDSEPEETLLSEGNENLMPDNGLFQSETVSSLSEDGDFLLSEEINPATMPLMTDGVASSGTCGEKLTWTLTDEGTLTISGTGEMTDFAENVFTGSIWYNNQSITEVIVEEGVTSIGSGAFYKCQNISSVSLPSGLVKIGNYAFDSCTSLSAVTIPDEVSSIGIRAFKDCKSFHSFTFPEQIHTISSYVLKGCSNLQEVSLPDYITEIGDGSFSDCGALSSITVPVSVQRIGSDAFYGCSSMTDLYYPGTNVDWYAIHNDSRASLLANNTVIRCTEYLDITGTCGSTLSWILTTDGVLMISGTGKISFSSTGYNPWQCSPDIRSVIIGEGVDGISSNAFYGCSHMENVSLPEGLSVIEREAFRDCTGLKNITLPDGLKSIDVYTFYKCSQLTSVTVPESVSSIDPSAFIDTSPDLVIYGMPGSYAQTFAEGQGTTFGIMPHEHTFGNWVVTTKQTCIAQGSQEHSCSICSLKETSAIPANGHKAVKDAAVAATCTKTGKTEGSHCSVCGAVIKQQTVIPVNGHKAVKDAAVSAACTKNGKTEGSHCSVCGTVIKQQTVVPALGHSWGSYTTTKKATALTAGEQVRTCSRCKAQEKRSIPTLKATYAITSTTFTVYEGASTDKLKITALALGDGVRQWSSSNRKVATVSSAGVIKGIKAGNANITITLNSGLTVIAKVKVLKKTEQTEEKKQEKTAKKVKTKKIKGLKKTLKIKKGKKIKLKPKLKPANSTDVIRYKSSNKKIVTVSKKGVIKAKKAGTAKITVKAGKAKFVIKVKVRK